MWLVSRFMFYEKKKKKKQKLQNNDFLMGHYSLSRREESSVLSSLKMTAKRYHTLLHKHTA